MGENEGCYICNENEGATTTPTAQSGNTTAQRAHAVPSTAPTISPAAGAISGATTVTLADSGTNHSIYYTTDGSTPTTASTLYTAPFSVNPGTTVKAIGMWGQGANPTSYPSGYGYLPSSVVTASYTTAGSMAKQPRDCEVSAAVTRERMPSRQRQTSKPAGNKPAAAVLLRCRRSCAANGRHRQHDPVEGDRHLQRWFDQRCHHGLCVDVVRHPHHHRQLLPGCFQDWPPEKQPSPAATRDTRPQCRQSAASAK